MRLRNLFSVFGKSEKGTESGSLKKQLTEWISKIESNTKPPEEITALNFGLFESDKGYMIYLTGSKSYDANYEDWASEIDYEPDSNLKYLSLNIENNARLEWDELLQQIVSTLKEVIKEKSDYSLFYESGCHNGI